MFQAIPCSSSGGHIVLLQHLVLSLFILLFLLPAFTSGASSPSYRHDFRLVLVGCHGGSRVLVVVLQNDNHRMECWYQKKPQMWKQVGGTKEIRVTIPEAVTIQFYLSKMSMVLLKTCRGL